MMAEKQAGPATRRQFLTRCAKAGLSVAATCSLGYCLHDTKGPLLPAAREDLVTLPDFSAGSQKGKIAIAKGADRINTINKALTALGGMETFIQKGDRVLLKVNAAFATPAILSATTNPELLAEVARLCFKAGAASVRVTDNPINDPSSCFELTGIGKAAEAAGASMYLPKDGFFRNMSVPGGALIKNWPFLYEPFQGVNKVIGICPVKDHHRSGASMAIKNWYGLLGGRRNVFHQNIHLIIKELAMMIRPTLVILDGTVTMMTNGPTGGSLSDLKQTDTMIVSTDQVAADAFGATLLEKTAGDFPFIQKAQEAGAGNADYNLLSPIRI